MSNLFEKVRHWEEVGWKTWAVRTKMASVNSHAEIENLIVLAF